MGGLCGSDLSCLSTQVLIKYSGKRPYLIIEHIDIQHASFYWNKEVSVFTKHLVALREALYQSVVIRWKGRHSSALNTERGVRYVVLFHNISSIYTLTR